MNTATLVADYLKYNRQEFDPKEVRLSELGSCSRRQTLRILGYKPTKPNTKKLGIHAMGHLLEEWVARRWGSQYEVQLQVEVKTPFGTGHIDIWVPELRRIVECKTTSEKSKPYLPKEENIFQLNTYLHFYDQEATAELVYIIKDTLEIVPFEIQYDPVMGYQAEQRAADIVQAVNAGSVLEIPAGYSENRVPCSWTGGRCEFYRYCYGKHPVEGALVF